MRLPPGPGPHTNPAQTIRYFREITSDTIGFVQRRFDRFGDIYYAPVRGTGLFVSKHPDHLDEVLRTKARSFEKTTTGFAARRLFQLLGNGLVNANGEHWRRHRRMINPALSRKRIQSYGPTIAEYARDEVARWQFGQRVAIDRQMAALTLRIVTRVLFDQDAGSYVDRVAEAMDAFREAQGLGSLLPSWVPHEANRRFEDALSEVNRIIDDMIASRRAATDLGDDLLSMMVGATDDDGTQFDDQELRDELLTLFFAGHETTSNALVWTLYLLSQNPDAERWVREELHAYEGEIEIERLGELSRTTAAIEEALRLLPPVCVVSRTASEDVEIGGYEVPAGAEFLAWFYHTHRDARWFPEPLVYRPQRFVEEPTWPKAAYMPFGAGQRTCIGKHFALMEATLILAVLMRARRFEYVESAPPVPSIAITLAPRDPLRLRVQPV